MIVVLIPHSHILYIKVKFGVGENIRVQKFIRVKKIDKDRADQHQKDQNQHVVLFKTEHVERHRSLEEDEAKNHFLASVVNKFS